MRLLFSADLQGDQAAYARYAGLLADHDAGVFAGVPDRYHRGRSLAKFSRRRLSAPEGTDVLVSHAPAWKRLDRGGGIEWLS